MLQTGLAAVFGFFAALFLVLLLAPAIARRVSELTWRQATRVLPQSSEEIAAGRDHLRGQNALDMRKLEMKMEAVAEKERQLRIGKQAFEDQIVDLRNSAEELNIRIAGLEANKAQLIRELNSSVQTNAMLTTENADRDVRFTTLSSEYSNLRGDHARQVSAFALMQEAHNQIEQRFDMARTEASALRSKVSAAESELRIARSEAKRHEGDAKLASRKIIALEAKLERSIRSMAEAEERLERREAELKRLKEQTRQGAASIPAVAAKTATMKTYQATAQMPSQVAVQVAAQAPVPVQTATAKSDLIVAQISELRPALRTANTASVVEKSRLKTEMMELAGRVTAEAAMQNPSIMTKVAQLKPGSALANAILKHNKAAE